MINKTVELVKSTNARVYFLLLSSTILSCLSVVRPSIGWLALICLIPMLAAIDLMQENKWKSKKIIFSIWLFGLLFLCITTSWILNINTSGWSYIEYGFLKFLVVITWLIFSLELSIGFAVFGWLITKFHITTKDKLAWLIIPCAWVISEYLRSIITSLATFGPGGSVGNYFSFGTIGYAITNTPMSYSSRLIGLYGLSFFAVAINISIYWIVRKKWRLPLLVVAIIIILSALGYYAFAVENKKTISTAVLQLGKSDRSSYENEIVQNIATDNVVYKKSPDVVVLPEYANFFETGNSKTKELFKDILDTKEKTLYVFSRSKNFEYGPRKNEIVFRTEDGSEVSNQEKNFLIPAGEYMPYSHQAILKIMGQEQIIDIFNKNVSVSKGFSPEYPVLLSNVSYAALACSGAIAPELYRDLSSQGANVLINSASLDVFSSSLGYRDQAESMIKFSSIANARPFLQSSRGGFSYIVDYNGKIIAKSKDEKINILSSSVMTNDKKTIFTIMGEYFVYLSASVLLISYINKKIKKK